jgi:hypothetical protein
VARWKLGQDGKPVEIIEEHPTPAAESKPQKAPEFPVYEGPNPAFLELMGASGHTGAPPLKPVEPKPSAHELTSSDVVPPEAPSPSLVELVVSDLQAATVPTVPEAEPELLAAYGDALELALRLRGLIERSKKT